MAQERIQCVDIAKGLGMLMVVFGHLDMYGMNLDGASSFIYVFHVPLFFFLSGLFFRKNDTIGKTIVSKLKGLYLPYLLANVAFFAIDALRGRPHTGGVGFLFGLQIAPLVGSLWFVICLFYSAVLYKLVDKLCRGNLTAVSIIAMSAFIIGYKIPQLNIVNQTLVGFFIYHIGRLISEFDGLSRWAKLPFNIQTLAFAVSGTAIWFLNKVHDLNMASGQYGMPLLFILGVMLGIIFTFSLSCILANVPKVGTVFEYVGKRTMWIIVFHMALIQAVFVFHGFILAYVEKMDIPTWVWYILAFLVSSFVPCLLRDGWKFIVRVRGKHLSNQSTNE